MTPSEARQFLNVIGEGTPVRRDIGTNEAGVIPLETKVVVRLEPIATKVGSLFIPESTRDTQQHAQIDATVIAVGPMAFSDGLDADGNVRHWPGPTPQPGDRVKISRYSGQDTKTAMQAPKEGDAPTYRIIQDKDVAGICV